ERTWERPEGGRRAGGGGDGPRPREGHGAREAGACGAEGEGSGRQGGRSGVGRGTAPGPVLARLLPPTCCLLPPRQLHAPKRSCSGSTVSSPLRRAPHASTAACAAARVVMQVTPCITAAARILPSSVRIPRPLGVLMITATWPFFM